MSHGVCDNGWGRLPACPGAYCGRTVEDDGFLSDCQSCLRGYIRNHLPHQCSDCVRCRYRLAGQVMWQVEQYPNQSIRRDLQAIQWEYGEICKLRINCRRFSSSYCLTSFRCPSILEWLWTQSLIYILPRMRSDFRDGERIIITRRKLVAHKRIKLLLSIQTDMGRSKPRVIDLSVRWRQIDVKSYRTHTLSSLLLNRDRMANFLVARMLPFRITFWGHF